jgi:hypothetical protein
VGTLRDAGHVANPVRRGHAVEADVGPRLGRLAGGDRRTARGPHGRRPRRAEVAVGLDEAPVDLGHGDDGG